MICMSYRVLKPLAHLPLQNYTQQSLSDVEEFRILYRQNQQNLITVSSHNDSYISRSRVHAVLFPA